MEVDDDDDDDGGFKCCCIDKMVEATLKFHNSKKHVKALESKSIRIRWVQCTFSFKLQNASYMLRLV